MRITTAPIARQRVERMLLRWQERAREADGAAGVMAEKAVRDLALVRDYVDSVAPEEEAADALKDERADVPLLDADGAEVDGTTVPSPPRAGTAHGEQCRAVTGYGERCRQTATDDGEATLCDLHADRIE